MVSLNEIVKYTNSLLEIEKFHDYAPNGLQVEGGAKVKKLVSGVTASQELVDAAVGAKANLLLVHHGYFWKSEDPCVTGMKRKRLHKLLNNDVSLLAYHLPLDAHAKFGNNVELAKVLGFNIEGRFGPESENKIAMYGALPKPLEAVELVQQIQQQLGRQPMHIPGRVSPIRTIGWCTGAAQGYIELAVSQGVDAFLSGEISEQTTHVAREMGIHYFAAGHHATERYGVQALAEHLCNKFSLEHEFIDIDNPV